MKCFIAYLIALLTAISASADELPDSILGAWEVTEVHTNTEATRTPFYAWNDPRIIGRMFKFSAENILNDSPEAVSCQFPKIKTNYIDTNELIKTSMAEYGYPPKQSDAGVYRLAFAHDTSNRSMQIYCKDGLWNGNLGVEGGVQGSWLVMLNENRILLRWYDETILVLSKVSTNQRPRPSFDCHRSNNSTEVKICDSVELSNFDRSVDVSYKLAVSQYINTGQDIISLERDQRKWIATRNRCGVNKECIITSMRKRLDFLSELHQ